MGVGGSEGDGRLRGGGLEVEAGEEAEGGGAEGLAGAVDGRLDRLERAQREAEVFAGRGGRDSVKDAGAEQGAGVAPLRGGGEPREGGPQRRQVGGSWRGGEEVDGGEQRFGVGGSSEKLAGDGASGFRVGAEGAEPVEGAPGSSAGRR
ncbi:MAG: hypothetical protein KatS3mg064_1671 [Tepidiforma sp.]|nr:MAG: hypothetical protein KatS3mg064_1671 [Tepidiforma sp.]